MAMPNEKNVSGPAEGSSMGNSVKKIGSAPSKTNDQQPVPSNDNFGVKNLAFKKVTSGY